MNYTTLTLGDKKIGLKFGMASFRYLQSKFNDGRSFTNDDLNEISISHILYSGHYNNCLVKDVEPQITFEELVDYVETNLLNPSFVEEIKRIVDVWSQNDFIKKAQEVSEDSKKKTRGKK